MSYASFRIEVDPKADRELKKLHRTHPAIVDKLIRLIDGLLADPFQGKPLKGAKQAAIRSDTGTTALYMRSTQRTVLFT